MDVLAELLIASILQTNVTWVQSLLAGLDKSHGPCKRHMNSVRRIVVRYQVRRHSIGGPQVEVGVRVHQWNGVGVTKNSGPLELSVVISVAQGLFPFRILPATIRMQ